jgi:hypothetical protein
VVATLRMEIRRMMIMKQSLRQGGRAVVEGLSSMCIAQAKGGVVATRLKLRALRQLVKGQTGSKSKK